MALAQKPLLVVRGEKSDLLTAERRRTDAERRSPIKLVTLPGVGHAPELDEPEAVAAIDEFLGFNGRLRDGAPADAVIVSCFGTAALATATSNTICSSTVKQPQLVAEQDRAPPSAFEIARSSPSSRR